MPKAAGPAFIRTAIARFFSSGGAAALSPDFAANTLATIWGGAGGFVGGYIAIIEKLRFTVGAADFTGAAGTLTYELRRDSATGAALASLTITLATALRGAVLEASVTAANDSLARVNDTTKLFLVRLAAGTAFTAGEGTWEVLARQPLQARI